MDDPQSAQPEATRTGTVPDAEYDAVMAEYSALVEQQGQLARVAEEVNGELEVRAAANAIEELDTLEETLERVRTCSMPAPEIA